MAKKKAKKPKKPKTTVTQVSLVLAAGVHNPSIMNPDFLKTNEIVPQDWKVVESFNTAMLSQVGFKNSVKIILEPQRLLITFDALSDFDEELPIYSIAAGYVEALPHVPYSALGINWKVVIPRTRPDNWIIKRFMGTGEWQNEKPKIVGAGLTLQMRDRKILTSFKIRGAKITFPGQAPFMGIEVETNAHHKGPFRNPDEITKLIYKWPDRRQFVYEQTKRLIGRL